MKKFVLIMKIYAPSVLRLAMVAVILWFSLQQFLHNDQYMAYVPDSVVALSHLSATVLVFFNAVFELVFGVLLAFGWQTRIVSLLLALHLFDIMYVVGYGQIGARDFGLAVATFVVFMNGPDVLCIQRPKKIVLPPQSVQSLRPLQSMQPPRYSQPIQSPQYQQSLRPTQPAQSPEPIDPAFRQPRRFS
jgi:uncharacterized membrane protein YphA (DoxX/SURF4 family)